MAPAAAAAAARALARSVGSPANFSEDHMAEVVVVGRTHQLENSSDSLPQACSPRQTSQTNRRTTMEGSPRAMGRIRAVSLAL